MEPKQRIYRETDKLYSILWMRSAEFEHEIPLRVSSICDCVTFINALAVNSEWCISDLIYFEWWFRTTFNTFINPILTFYLRMEIYAKCGSCTFRAWRHAHIPRIVLIVFNLVLWPPFRFRRFLFNGMFVCRFDWMVRRRYTRSETEFTKITKDGPRRHFCNA